MSSDLVKVATFNNEAEAELARGRLEEAGIQAFVAADDAGGMYPVFQMVRGVKLLVAPVDADSAREILAPDEEST
jgi:hypothetical protein